MKLIDISLPLEEGMPTYPKNPPFCMTQVAFIPDDRSNNSELSLGTHTGTHVDAPKHVSNSGKGADKIALGTLYGPCKVLDLSHCTKSITAKDLKKHRIGKNDIILLKTRNSARGTFAEKYIYVEPDAAEHLVQKKVKTVGIDALSIKEPGTDNKAVHTLLIKNMTVFEGLNLKGVKAGTYTFCGLPLRIVGADGAPARAILIK